MPPPPHYREPSAESAESGSWDQYRLYVVENLKTINATLKIILDKQTRMEIKLAIWSAAFGFIGGIIPIAIESLLWWKEIHR
jgi:uncharacterized protein (UPF0303 family)